MTARPKRAHVFAMIICSCLSIRIIVVLATQCYVPNDNSSSIALFATNFRMSRQSVVGYITYREVVGYYSGEENAYDMRKALPRDVEKKSMKPFGRLVYPHEVKRVVTDDVVRGLVAC